MAHPSGKQYTRSNHKSFGIASNSQESTSGPPS